MTKETILDETGLVINDSLKAFTSSLPMDLGYNHSQKITADRGEKADGAKVRYDLVPPEVLHSLALITTYGANKYQPRNWEAGMNWGRLYAAAMRHLNSYAQREDIDPESGYLHLEHALCSIAFLLTYAKRGIGTDDRPEFKKNT